MTLQRYDICINSTIVELIFFRFFQLCFGEESQINVRENRRGGQI